MPALFHRPDGTRTLRAMKAREFHPRRLDVRPFAEAGEPIDGSAPLGDFERLLQLRHTEAAPHTAAPVRWSAQGELRPRRGGPPEVWLYLTGSTSLSQQCQRCLETVEVPLAFERWFLFVDNERQAAELDAEAEDDVLVISRQFDLLELVEDELLLVAPIVPRHALCPTPVVLSVGDWSDEPADTESEAGTASAETATTDKPNPFAALAALRKTPAKD
ncbi:DUF177 domain-containing protein [Sphaerotilus sp.]|uniref:YceD family protein n=1 Tax=Sphaerotilus sp. TaxID=2093942 RepID=UPI0034E20228